MPMSSKEQRLAHIRDQIAQARALEHERDQLLRDLGMQSGYTLERLAQLAGITRGRVHQIIGKRQVAET